MPEPIDHPFGPIALAWFATLIPQYRALKDAQILRAEPLTAEESLTLRRMERLLDLWHAWERALYDARAIPPLLT